jgi:hypothetical protein
MILNLSHNPVVALIGIVDRVWERVFGCQSIVDTKNRYIKFICPPSQVGLRAVTRLTNESPAMEMDDNLADFLAWQWHLHCVIFFIYNLGQVRVKNLLNEVDSVVLAR